MVLEILNQFLLRNSNGPWNMKGQKNLAYERPKFLECEETRVMLIGFP